MFSLNSFQPVKARLITSWQFQSYETDPLKMFKQLTKGLRCCFGYNTSVSDPEPD
jgi:hypothetical protein